ncbi:MAG: DNA adenine methylase [Candidatus Marinimicrobia bacterium]|nr:DNA adenine methylase [Candidatus Neomarinimicrobiota bacterium]
MGSTQSPLRYPGGKSILSEYLGNVLAENQLSGSTYVEPYAGGAGAALALLFSDRVSKICLNDIDIHIYSMWNSILERPDDFLRLVEDTPITIKEWHKQENIYSHHKDYSSLDVGFATFFLNRCNRSGILYARPIGGLKQDGEWKLDARFNKTKLLKKVEKIAYRADSISFDNMDAQNFIKERVGPLARKESVFVYYDPPYFKNGKQLYLNHYDDEAHENLAVFIMSQTKFCWLLSYDDVPEIRHLYGNMVIRELGLFHFAYRARKGKELLITDHRLTLPRT